MSGIILFAVAFAVRVAWLMAYPCEAHCNDSAAFWLNSAGFPHLPQLVQSCHGEVSVWQHNPGLLLWGWLFHPVWGTANALAGALTCGLIEREQRGAGWILALWAPHVAATSLMLKWIPAGLAMAIVWHCARRRLWLLLPAGALLYVAFFSLGWQNTSEFASDQSAWFRIWGFWAPVLSLGNLPLSVWVMPWFLGTACFGLVLALAWFRFVKLDAAWSIGLVALLTAGAALTRGAAQQRIVFEPLLIAAALRALVAYPAFDPRTARFWWQQDEWEESLG